MFLPKSLRGGGSRLSRKIAGGGGYFGFYYIFINKGFETSLRGVLYLPSPHLPPLPVCIYVLMPMLSLLKTLNFYSIDF